MRIRYPVGTDIKTTKMTNPETQQVVKDIIMQIISDVEHTLEILDKSNKLGNKRHFFLLVFQSSFEI